MFKELYEAIKELPASSVLRERLEFNMDRLVELRERNIELENEAAELRKQNEELREKLAEKFTPEDYFKHRGVLFWKKEDGTYLDQPFCPRCKEAMSSFMGQMTFICSICEFEANFTPRELPKIMEELP
jgi:regulator of replication initiation timing